MQCVLYLKGNLIGMIHISLHFASGLKIIHYVAIVTAIVIKINIPASCILKYPTKNPNHEKIGNSKNSDLPI